VAGAGGLVGRSAGRGAAAGSWGCRGLARDGIALIVIVVDRGRLLVPQVVARADCSAEDPGAVGFQLAVVALDHGFLAREAPRGVPFQSILVLRPDVCVERGYGEARLRCCNNGLDDGFQSRGGQAIGPIWREQCEGLDVDRRCLGGCILV
jgi:hypothetical protein